MASEKRKFSRSSPPLWAWLAAIAMISSSVSQVSASVLLDYASADAVQSKLPVYEWSDSSSKKTRSIVITIHGATQEATCFDQLARKLARQGFLVCSMDLRGHGLWHFRQHEASRLDSDGNAEGFTVDYNQSVLDFERLLDHLKKKYPDAPIFCIGESAGAAVLVKAGVDRPDVIKGMVLASPGTHPVMHKLDWLVPDVLKGFKNLAHPLEIKRYITRYSSDDPRVTREMNDNPLGRHSMSGKELLATTLFIRNTADRMKELNGDIPLLILQGTEDQVCSPTSVKAIVRKNPGLDKQLVFLRNCGHVLLGTRFIKPQISTLVVDWLTKHNETALAARDARQLALTRSVGIEQL